MVDVQNFCELNQAIFCNQAHQRINEELEDIFTIMLENSYPNHDRDTLVNSASFLSAGLCGLSNACLIRANKLLKSFQKESFPP